MTSVYFFATSVLLQIISVKRDKIKTIYTPLYNNLLQFFGWNQTTLTVPLKTPTEQYYQNQLHRFLKTYDTNYKYSDNIDSCFYEKNNLKQMLLPENNMLEIVWKRRILYESTPRGNIVMYYDPYKLGFAYFSDSNTISVTLLNAAAMKYCISYRCRDFFMDNGVTPENNHSALIPIHCVEAPRQKDGIDKSPNVKIDTTAFAKFKNYSKQTDKSHTNNITASGNASTTMLNPKNIFKNKFIYMGKTCNMNFLQPMKKHKNTINGFSSQHLDDLKGETLLQHRVLSYKDFKQTSIKDSK